VSFGCFFVPMNWRSFIVNSSLQLLAREKSFSYISKGNEKLFLI